MFSVASVTLANVLTVDSSENLGRLRIQIRFVNGKILESGGCNFRSVVDGACAELSLRRVVGWDTMQSPATRTRKIAARDLDGHFPTA